MTDVIFNDRDALSALGSQSGTTIVFADQMRLGLHSQLRRRWFPCGMKLRQKQPFHTLVKQMRFVWRWLYLCVEAGTGKLRWLWQGNMKKESMAHALQTWQTEQVETVVSFIRGE